MPRGTAGVMKELEDRQKRRRTRTQRDSLDLALIDLTGFYRDVLALQLGSRLAIANAEVRGHPGAARPRRLAGVAPCAASRRSPRAARRWTATWRPLLAVEAMTMALQSGLTHARRQPAGGPSYERARLGGGSLVRVIPCDGG